MKKSKRILAALMAAAMGASLMTGCTSNGSTTPAAGDTTAATPAEDAATPAAGAKKDIKDVVIGLSIGHTTEERWQREITMFEDYAKEKGFKLEVQVAQNSPEKQVSQCENLIAQGIDVLVIQSIDAEAAAPIVNAAHEENVPVISYDRFIMNADLDYYITFDSYKVGKTEAEFVVSKANKGNFIWLKGSSDDNNAALVAAGQKEVLQPYIDKGDIKIVLEQWCEQWDPNVAMDHTENGLTLAHNDIQGVIASNDGTAGGAVQALVAQGLAGKVPICGQDADLAACQRIVEGIQTGTVYKPISMLNQAACELAVAVATGADPMTSVDSKLGTWQKLNNNTRDVDSFTVDVLAIDKDNIDDIIIKRDKFHPLESVYANIPKDKWPTLS